MALGKSCVRLKRKDKRRKERKKKRIKRKEKKPSASKESSSQGADWEERLPEVTEAEIEVGVEELDVDLGE